MKVDGANMADPEACVDVQLLKSTKIHVFVDEALPDMLVVTYELGVRIFKGVLLDYTKRNLPHGIQALHPAFSKPAGAKPNPDDDILYSVNQRFAYTEPGAATAGKPKNVRIPSKYKNNKMTVRLRPRQVLCSKCKGICNENSENVSKKRKVEATTGANASVALSSIVKRSANAPVTRSVYSEQKKKGGSGGVPEMRATLIPKVLRLQPRDISNALSGKYEALPDTRELSKRAESTAAVEENDHSSQHSDSNSSAVAASQPECPPPPAPVPSENVPISVKTIKRTLRKKRSVGSMEDLWDETVFEENSKNNNSENANPLSDSMLNSANTCISTRTIKISYGPQGEGTVLKIPAPLDKFNTTDDSEENVETPEPAKSGNVNNKAARKALRRARKKARQKLVVSSPNYLSCNSPRYGLGMGSPRYMVVNASPRHYLGGNSPRYVTSSTELHLPKRHKHKMKRKKKHREDKDRKHKDEVSSAENANEQAVTTQKLSINLKRLNSAYTSGQSLSDRGEENSSSSDEHGEQVPDFPPPSTPLVLRNNAQPITSAPSADGGRLFVGDVVWGKIHGFPWWPGKVLAITTGSQGPQAHVAWYGSSTSSLILCDQLSPYLENFKIRYNKKKRGPYKEAIRQATTDAKENAESKKEPSSVVSSPAHSIITVPAPTLASPREIDVMS